MGSLALSLFTSLIVSLLVCQMATSRFLIPEPRAYDEATTIVATMFTEDGREEAKNLERSSNETAKANDLADTEKKNNESDIELMSRTFDTSPFTLNKFTAIDPDANTDDSNATTVTDDSNPDKNVQEITNVARRNLSAENSNGKNKCDKNKSVPEHGGISSRSSFAETNSDNDREDVLSRILEESDTARMIMKEFSALSQLDIAARVFNDPTPSKAQRETEEARIRSDGDSEQPESIATSFRKDIISYVADSPNAMKTTYITTAAEGDSSHKENESDTVTSNAMNRIASENENEMGSIQRGESPEMAAISEFADSHNVTETRKNFDGPSSYHEHFDMPEARFYADDKKVEDGDERGAKEYLKKIDDKWISIVINNYPSQVCNKGKM